MIRYLTIVALLVSLQTTSAQHWVVGVSPSQNAINAGVGTSISIEFTEAIDPESVAEGAVSVQGSLSRTHTISVIDYDSASRTVTIESDRSFIVGETVFAIATTGIEAAAGGHMPESFGWHFTIAPMQGSTTFEVAQTITVGQTPYGLVAADLDGDGFVDLATANRSGNSVTVLTNEGTGTFAVSETVSVPSTPEYVSVADFDWDGSMDLVVVSAGNNSITVLENDDSGSFTALDPVGVGSNPHTVSAGDVDGDGFADIVASNFSSSTVSVLLQTGVLEFTEASTPSVGSGAETPLLRDFDLDGDSDMAVPAFNSGNVTLLDNNGLGGFSNSRTVSVGSTPHLPTAGDFNNDGHVDIVVTGFGSGMVRLLTNDGAGEFEESLAAPLADPWAAAAADFDADGYLDLAVSRYNSSTVEILKNNGDGTFSSVGSIGVGSRPHSIVAADIDGDGDVDIACANDGSNTVTVLRNTAVPTGIGGVETPQEELRLVPPHPNPFGRTTTLGIETTGPTAAVVQIVGLDGRTVSSNQWVISNRGLSEYHFTAPARLAAGMYVYRLFAGERVLSGMLFYQP